MSDRTSPGHNSLVCAALLLSLTFLVLEWIQVFTPQRHLVWNRVQLRLTEESKRVQCCYLWAANSTTTAFIDPSIFPLWALERSAGHVLSAFFAIIGLWIGNRTDIRWNLSVTQLFLLELHYVWFSVRCFSCFIELFLPVFVEFYLYFISIHDVLLFSYICFTKTVHLRSLHLLRGWSRVCDNDMINNGHWTEFP